MRKKINVLELEGDFIIVGDIHGSLHDLLRILKFIQEKHSKVIFLGDYIDRGCFSLECITILFAMKVMNPDSFYLIRGNHEFEQLCRLYGFRNEIINYHDPQKTETSDDDKIPKIKKSQSLIIDDLNTEDDILIEDQYTNYCDMFRYKYTEKLYYSFIKAFSYLPISAILNKTTFCIHGGLSPKLDHIDDLNKKIPKPIITFETNDLLSDVVWSDPSYSLNAAYEENPRGRGCLFNIESALNFLKNNSLVRMIRAHQCVMNGSLQNFNGKCITVFSASSYDTCMGNSSAVLELFQCDDTIKVTTFEPLCRLQKSDAFYYKVESLTSKSKTCFSLLHPNLCSNFPSQKFDLLLAPKYHNSKSATLIVPKFTTNPRKSCAILKNPLSIISANALKNFVNENKYHNV